ncbi:hypothetical protein [Streptomyces hainanensis]|uniref:Uncharacterized protein n=1 Tax=Streptomyces hainanensis TaxID=402648 RepID=A0A4V2Y3K2_9ACTN|nr:hypothetical protein [Streptomyces hainanensis]TDC76815.1 hypothetical protein E1283_08935 [Streptomyces hainanensis]
MRDIWSLLAVATGVLCVLFTHESVVDLFDGQFMAALIGTVIAVFTGGTARWTWRRSHPRAARA